MRCFKSIRYLCVIMLLGSVFWTYPVWAETDGFTQYETDLLDKINEARRDPSKAAEEVSMTISLDNALCDLQVSSLLTETASNHTYEMADQHYYSYISQVDGRDPETRILDIGYNAALAGELLGLITFRNYMPLDKAVDILFKQLLKRDLQRSEDGEDAYIFNPEISEIGIALTAGRITIGGETYNGYILTCDFGKPTERQDSIQDMEFIFLDLLNRVRISPVENLVELGIDLPGLLLEHPELETFLSLSMAPVTYAPSFMDIAFNRNQDVFETVFTGADGVILPPSVDHCTESYSDCFAVSSELAAGYQDRGELSREEVVKLLFKTLLVQDLISSDPSEMTLLNPETREISVVFGHRQSNSDGKLIQRYVLTSAYGNGYLSLIEKQSLNLLNQARANYTEENEQTESMETSEFDTELEDSEASDTEGTQTITEDPLPPLTVNHIIYDTAGKHALEMIEYAYFDIYSFDGSLDLGERLDLAGYPSFTFCEEIEWATDEVAIDVEATAADKFDQLLKNANRPTPDSEGFSSLFSPVMENAGIKILYTPPMAVEETPEATQGETEDIAVVTPNSFQRVHTLLIVVDVAEPLVEKTEGVLVALVFEDTDLNGLYDRGEELADTPVDIYSEQDQASYRFYTDNAGSISIPLKAGKYELTLAEAEESEESKAMVVDMATENQLVTISFQPVPEVSEVIDEMDSVDFLFPFSGVDETIVNIN